MCNSYEQHVTWTNYRDAMEQAALKLADHQGEIDLPEADDVRISDLGPIMRLADDQVELSPMAFGLPKGKGGPVFNFRSEGRSFAESRRCLLAAAAWSPERLLPRFEAFFADVVRGRALPPFPAPGVSGNEAGKG